MARSAQFVVRLAMMFFCVNHFLTAQAQAQEQHQSGIPGYWKGTLSVQGIELELELHLAVTEGGDLTGKMVSVNQGGAEIPITSVKVDVKSIALKMPSVFAEYTATISEDGQRLEGTFTQAGTDSELVMEQMAAPESVTHIETWQGEMKTPRRVLEFQLRLYQNAAGEISAKLDSFTEGALGLQVLVEPMDDGLAFTLEIVDASYVGHFDESRTRLNGTWTQAGKELELNFVKVELEETQTELKLNRPQTPQPPYPYDIEEFVFTNDAESIELSGTLTIPNSEGPHPVAILITGSGPQDRDETIFGHKPFWVIADYLTRHGIAILRYDERGVGQSSGNFFTATSQDFANDVESAVKSVGKHPRIDAAQVGLIGHSEGGYIASMVASRNERIAFIVMLAGPGVPGTEILKKQTYEGSKLIGMSQMALDAQAALVSAYIDALLGSETQVEDSEEIQQHVAILREIVSKGSDIDKATSAAILPTLKALDTKWTRFFLAYDPGDDLQRVRCPVLAMIGSKDVQVDADINLTAIEQALMEGGNNNFQVKKLEGLNHLFQTAETGAGSEYSEIEETFAPAALETMAEWIQSQVTGK